MKPHALKEAVARDVLEGLVGSIEVYLAAWRFSMRLKRQLLHAYLEV